MIQVHWPVVIFGLAARCNLLLGFTGRFHLGGIFLGSVTPLHLLTRWHCLPVVFSHDGRAGCGVDIHKKTYFVMLLSICADVLFNCLHTDWGRDNGLLDIPLLITSFWPDALAWPPLAVL
jgi:hypothetical protein